jgi:hypothetical protein
LGFRAFSSSSWRNEAGIRILIPIRVEGISPVLIFRETVGREIRVAAINSETVINWGIDLPHIYKGFPLAKMRQEAYSLENGLDAKTNGLTPSFPKCYRLQFHHITVNLHRSREIEIIISNLERT